MVGKVKELNKKQITKRLQNGRVKRKRDTANGKTLFINLVTHKYVIHRCEQYCKIRLTFFILIDHRKILYGTEKIQWFTLIFTTHDKMDENK